MLLIMNCEVKLSSSIEGELKINAMFCSVFQKQVFCDALGWERWQGMGQGIVCRKPGLKWYKLRPIWLICLQTMNTHEPGGERGKGWWYQTAAALMLLMRRWCRASTSWSAGQSSAVCGSHAQAVLRSLSALQPFSARSQFLHYAVISFL